VKYHRKFIESAEAEAAGKQGQKPSKLVFAPDELPPEQTASKLTERKRLPVSEVKARPKAPSASPQFGAAKNKGSAIVGGASPSPAGKGRHPAGSAATTDAALSLIRRPARGANDGDIGAETVDGMATAAESANKGKRKIEGYLAMCVPKG
jgi:hypothetical protein